jgi:hypothetical protein
MGWEKGGFPWNVWVTDPAMILIAMFGITLP